MDTDLVFYEEYPVNSLIVLLHFYRANGKLLPHPPAARTQAARKRSAAFSLSSYCGSQRKRMYYTPYPPADIDLRT